MIIFNESALGNFTGGYGFGELYLWSNPTEKLVPNYASYDCLSKKFHIISNERLGINEKIDEIRVKLIKEIKKSTRFTKSRSITYDNERPVFVSSCGNRSSKRIDPLQLEKYIGVVYKDYFYMLCFELMFIDEKKICNVLGDIQYYKCLIVEGKVMGINENRAGKLDICYPLKGKTMRIMEDGRKTTNSKYKLDSDVKDILDEFYDFIVNKDEFE